MDQISLTEVLAHIDATDLPAARKRDMKSAVNSICSMAAVYPASVIAEPPALRHLLSSILPAQHDLTEKTWSNLRSLFVAALAQTGVVEPLRRGVALAHPAWSALARTIAHDKRLHCGLAAFLNWCAGRGIAPDAVGDADVLEFHTWLELRTLCPSAHDHARRVPRLWNEAQTTIGEWPRATLKALSFRPPPTRLRWAELTQSFQDDVESYLAMRARPDVFDDRANMPKRPLAPATVKLQREQIHSAVSVLIRNAGVAVGEIRSLADIVQADRFKAVLRHFHANADRKPNAFLESLARTLIQVGRFHAGLSGEEIAQMKRAASKLPPTPFDLTAKNKALLSQLESDSLRGRLLFLPDRLWNEVVLSQSNGRVRHALAQVALALDILLAVPLRAQNLCALHWKRHFNEPDGPKGRLILCIPAAETKSKRRDYVAEVPAPVAENLRWYRNHIMPRLAADPHGFLFVKDGGLPKSQETLSQQIVEAIADHVGIHMTPHQFRHLAATLYLERNPGDFETARSLLSHAHGKTTLVYAGSSSRRASRAYGQFLVAERENLKFAGSRMRRTKKPAKRS